MRWFGWCLLVVGIALCAGTLPSGCDSGGDDPGVSEGGETAGSEAGEEIGASPEDCAVACQEASAGPPMNDCLAVGGIEQCVYTCASDADCEEPFYSGCTQAADDGTMICQISG